MSEPAPLRMLGLPSLKSDEAEAALVNAEHDRALRLECLRLAVEAGRGGDSVPFAMSFVEFVKSGRDVPPGERP